MSHVFARCFAHGFSIEEDFRIFLNLQVHIEGRAWNFFNSRTFMIRLAYEHFIEEAFEIFPSPTAF